MGAAKKQAHVAYEKLWFGLIAVVLVVLSWAGGYRSARRNSELPSVSQRIVNGTGVSILPSLKQFLTTTIEQSDSRKECLPGGLAYSVLKQTATQAKMFSRCNDSFPIDAVMVHGRWTLPSITNNFPDYPLPVCSYVQKNSISSAIEPYCYQDAQTGGTAMPVLVANTIN